MGEVLGSAHIEEGQISRCHLHEERHSCANSGGPFGTAKWIERSSLYTAFLPSRLPETMGVLDGLGRLCRNRHPHTLGPPNCSCTRYLTEPCYALRIRRSRQRSYFYDSTLEVSGHSVKET